MTARVFVDTNVLVYARDASEPPKQKQAMAWMACRYLLTEDLQDNLRMGNVEVINPFRTSPEAI